MSSWREGWGQICGFYVRPCWTDSLDVRIRGSECLKVGLIVTLICVDQVRKCGMGLMNSHANKCWDTKYVASQARVLLPVPGGLSVKLWQHLHISSRTLSVTYWAQFMNMLLPFLLSLSVRTFVMAKIYPQHPLRRSAAALEDAYKSIRIKTMVFIAHTLTASQLENGRRLI